MKTKRCKIWDKKLVELQGFISGLPIDASETNDLNDKVFTIRKKLAEVAKMLNPNLDGKVTHEQKRQNVISLAIVNPTLSMSAIARHYGYSEAFVAKVCREHGAEINAGQEEVRRPIRDDEL
jgi:hypothetical protein